jgi:hypothetical protein
MTKIIIDIINFSIEWFVEDWISKLEIEKKIS